MAVSVVRLLPPLLICTLKPLGDHSIVIELRV